MSKATQPSKTGNPTLGVNAVEWPIVKLMVAQWCRMNGFPDRTGMSIHHGGHTYDAIIEGDEFIVDIRRHTARHSMAMDRALRLGKQVAQQSRHLVALENAAKAADAEPGAVRGKNVHWTNHAAAKAELEALKAEHAQCVKDSEQPVERVSYPMSIITEGFFP